MSLQAYCQTDTITYPHYYKDSKGNKLVVITEQHQEFITYNLLEFDKCKVVKEKQFEYIGVLEAQINDFESMSIEKDSLNNQCSIMLQNREDKIKNLEEQKRLQEGIVNNYKLIEKKNKKKLLGWKIGTFTVIGVFAIALPTTIAILAK